MNEVAESTHPYTKLEDAEQVPRRAPALRQNPPNGFHTPRRGRTHFGIEIAEEDDEGPRLPPPCARREVSDPTAELIPEDNVNTPMRETASERQSRRTKSQSPHRLAHDQYKPAPGHWGGTPLGPRRTMERQKTTAFFILSVGAAGEAFAFPNYMYCVNCGYSVTAKVAQGVGLCELCWKTAKTTCQICNENLPLKQMQWGSGLCKNCFDHAQKDCAICGIGLADSQLKWQTGMCDSCYDNYEKHCTLCEEFLDVNQVKWRTGLCDKCYNSRPKSCMRCHTKLERSRMEWKTGLCTECVNECNKSCRDCGSEISLGSWHWSTSLCDRCYDRYDKMCRGCRQRLEPHLRSSGTCTECRDQCTQLCQMCRKLFLPNQVHWETGMCDKCYDQCMKVCCRCKEPIQFGQLKWGTGLCDTCYVESEKTCRVCREIIEFQQLRWGTRLCNPCFDKCDTTCRQCQKKLELGELYWGTGRCNTCYELNRLPKKQEPLKAGVKAAIWSQLIFYMAPGILQPSLYLKLQASMRNTDTAQSYSLVLATASIAAMVAPIPLGAWATKRGEKEVYIGVCLVGALAALILAFPVNVPIFALGWALLTFPPAVRGVRATFFAKHVDPTELSRAGQLASTFGLVGGFLGPVASTLVNQAFGEPCPGGSMDGFVFGSILSFFLLLLSAMVMVITFEVPRPKSKPNIQVLGLRSRSKQDVNSFDFDDEKCDRCSVNLTVKEISYGTELCNKCFDSYGGENVNFGRYWKRLLIVFCIIAALLEFSMNAGVIATFQPIVVEHFNWGNDLIAAVNVLGTGLSMGVSLVVAQWRLGEREQAAGAAGLYLLGVLAFTFPPLQDWRLVLGMMLGVKAQILFMAPFTAVFSNLIGGARVTNFLTTMLCLAPAIGAALGTLAAPLFVQAAGTPAFFLATVPAIAAIFIIIAGWTRVSPAATR